MTTDEGQKSTPSGTFTEARKAELLKKLTAPPPTEQHAWEVSGREKAFDTFSEALHPDVNVIYYPGPDSDISPSRTPSFKNARIIYVDPNQVAVKALQDAGCEAHVGDAKTFDPGTVDLLLLLNFYNEKPLEFVAENGYVICNEHWGGGIFTDMLKRKDFEFVGALTNTDGTIRFDRDNLDKYSQNPQFNRVNEENLFVLRKLPSATPQ